MRRRSQLPREIGLQLRMAVALALSGALLVAVVGALLYVTVFVEKGWSLAFIVATIVGIGAVRVLGAPGRLRSRPVPKGAERRLRRAVQRLALVADEPPPKSAVVRSDVPLSWTFAPLRGMPTIHVTTGLLDRLEDAELQAVVGHEIGHVLHRDALVVTLLAGPPAYFFAGLRQMVSEDPVRGVIGGLTFLVFLGPPVFVMLLLSRLVCRHRELAADRAAALLTGSPAAVAAALIAVDESLAAQRDRDLRRVAPRDAFHFVPARSPRFVGRLWATHPRLRRRVERMERLEAGIQR